MDLRTPYSHTFSLMFAVVEISSKKKAMIRATVPTIPVKTWKRKRETLMDLILPGTSMRKVKVLR